MGDVNTRYLIVNERGELMSAYLPWGEAVKVLKTIRAKDPDGAYTLKNNYEYERGL